MSKIFVNNFPLILASSSPRRQQFLLELGLDFEIVVPDIVEPEPILEELAPDFAIRTAKAKCQHVFAELCKQDERKNSVILAADTVVSIDGQFLGKPKDSADALRMLKLLVGKKHIVSTGVCIMHKQGEKTFSSCANVYFANWSDAVLENYANCGEPLDKAGAYAIQGRGAFLVKNIEGEWSSVVGLPISYMVDALLTYQYISVK